MLQPVQELALAVKGCQPGVPSRGDTAPPAGGENPAMPARLDPDTDRTPRGRLAQARLHEVLGYHVAQAAIVTNAVFEEQIEQALGLRKVEFTVLSLIGENPGVTPAQLARALAFTPGNITMWVDRLVDKGLARREASTADRRAQHLYATPEGEARAAQAVLRIVEAEQARLRHLSAAEKAMLVELLSKVAAAR
jgi:DNA-binding MarR family transcriptional regulator